MLRVARMYSVLRSLLFALSPEEAHSLAFHAMAPLESSAFLRDRVRRVFPVPESLVISKMGLTFPTPIGLAGGFDKNALRTRALAALGFGFLEVGTVTAEAQEENPPPNMFRLPDDRAIVNRLGFPNDGAKAVAERLKRELGRGVTGVPVGFSIGKSRAVPIESIDAVAQDYLASFRAVREVADFVVVNVSSPNTKNLRALQGPELARTLLLALRREGGERGTHVPLLLKVSPDLTAEALDALLDVVSEVKLDGVVATNTTLSRAGLRSREDLVRFVGEGGLSGPPLHIRALEVVRRSRARLGAGVTIIGVGGIETGAAARAFLAEGADLVQLYTGFVYGGPGTPSRIARELGAIVSV
jgi:dihydroorotate dehydrogenase